MRCKILIFHFIIFLIVNYTASAQGLSYTGLLSAGGGKYDSGSFSGFGVIGGSFSSNIAKSHNYRNYQGFMWNAEMNTGIGKSLESFRIEVYPNPAINKLYIVSTELKITKIMILSITGITVMESRNESELNICRLPEGLYFIKFFNDENNCITVRRIIKQ